MSDTSNYTTPENKARFGFKLDADGQVVSAGLKGGDNGAVVSGPTVISDAEGSHNNGGGADESETLRAQLADTQSQLAQAQADLAEARKPGSESPDAGISTPPAEDLDSLTTAQIKEQLDAKAIQYKSSDAKPELLAALKAAQ